MQQGRSTVVDVMALLNRRKFRDSEGSAEQAV